MKIRIMRGLPGSGKSHFGTKVLPRTLPIGNSFAVCSADHFFIGEDGVYRFDPKKLAEAHKQCRQAFLEAVQNGKELIIVDNTNTLPTEIAFYYDLATLFTNDVKILTVVPPATLKEKAWLEQCQQKNQHGVPMQSIKTMCQRMQKHKLPWYWKELMVTREDGFFILSGKRYDA